jgi:hypothetical protein
MIGAILRASCLKRQKKLYFQQQHHHLLHNQIQDQYSLSEMQQCLFAMQGLQF